MNINLQDDDQISLSLLEIGVLLALSAGPSNGYQIQKTCSVDFSRPISHGSIRPALQRLGQAGLIMHLDPTDEIPRPGKTRIIHKLSPAGVQVLEWHINLLMHLASLAEDRHIMEG